MRAKSQLALAMDADVTQRHLSFIESGRANPSRTMVVTLADALEIPLRERNDLLLAAGFAPQYRQSPLDAEVMAGVRTALDRILAQHEPYPAIVIDRGWNLLESNRGAERLFGALIDLNSIPPPVNVLRLIFDPAGLRPAIDNWDEVAGRSSSASTARRSAMRWTRPPPDFSQSSLPSQASPASGVPAMS